MTNKKLFKHLEVLKRLNDVAAITNIDPKETLRETGMSPIN